MKNFPSVFLLAVALALAGCGGGSDEEADAGKDKAGTQASADAGKAGGGEGKGGKNGKNGEDKKPTAVPVEVAQVAERPLSARYSGTATLEAPGEAQVVAKTSGVLLKLEVEEGDRVRAGQVLARLDPERTRLEAQRAKAMLNKLEAEYARSTELFERKLVAADAHEKLRYDIATQRAAYELTQLELSYTGVIAPIDGVIAQRMVKLGNLIQLNEPMFRIVDLSRLEAVLNVPERELATMRADLPVQMQVDALPGTRFSGRVERVSPVVDAGSGTFRVTTVFEGDQGLAPGMFGRVEVVYDQRDAVLTVPRTALLDGEGESAVFVVREDKVQRVAVRLGYINGEFAEIRDGLTAGEQVVTTGKVALRDGSTIEVLNAPEPATVVADAVSATTAGNP
ncbi:MAG TPA: efflux RND transporter periplasmic adaptor subunit [Xanthomonadaceae bacterium]|nr:efflux RND transporter periplasmic adaptor subunit [Xanthomonadaceae bacterium]